VGKTTLMNEAKKFLDEQNKKTLYFNLDFEADFFYFGSHEKLIQKIELELGDNKGFVFIDEIQRKENAGLFLKGLFDRSERYKFIVSGSGSVELKEKTHESLTGRKRIFLIINEIFDSYLKKDIVYLLRVDRPDTFIKLIRLLAHYCGSIINYSKLASDVGISVPTLKKYLWFAENTFIIKTVHPYFKNKRKEITKSPTIYFNDLGLKNFALNQFGNEAAIINSGYLFQNLIFKILNEILNNQFYSIHYWRTSDQAEVDFIIDTGDQIIPCEVKFSQLKTDRVSRSYRNFINAYQPKKGYIVNLNYENEIRINNTTIKFIPFYKLYMVSF